MLFVDALMVLQAPDEIGVLSLERIRSAMEGQVHFLYRPLEVTF
jgi:hypothetical protein